MSRWPLKVSSTLNVLRLVVIRLHKIVSISAGRPVASTKPSVKSVSCSREDATSVRREGGMRAYASEAVRGR